MPRFFLGVDYRYALLSFGYVTLGGGLFMRFVMHGQVSIGLLMEVAFACFSLGTLFLYRGFAVHFLHYSWQLIQSPEDEVLLSRMEWMIAARRRTAMAVGYALGFFNNSLVLHFRGEQVFSWLSLGVIGLVVLYFQYRWFIRRPA